MIDIDTDISKPSKKIIVYDKQLTDTQKKLFNFKNIKS